MAIKKHYKHLRKELEAIKNTSYEEENKVFFIFPDEPDKRDWVAAKLYYSNKGKQIFYKVLRPQWKN